VKNVENMFYRYQKGKYFVSPLTSEEIKPAIIFFADNSYWLFGGKSIPNVCKVVRESRSYGIISNDWQKSDFYISLADKVEAYKLVPSSKYEHGFVWSTWESVFFDLKIRSQAVQNNIMEALRTIMPMRAAMFDAAKKDQKLTSITLTRAEIEKYGCPTCKSHDGIEIPIFQQWLCGNQQCQKYINISD